MLLRLETRTFDLLHQHFFANFFAMDEPKQPGRVEGADTDQMAQVPPTQFDANDAVNMAGLNLSGAESGAVMDELAQYILQLLFEDPDTDNRALVGVMEGMIEMCRKKPPSPVDPAAIVAFLEESVHRVEHFMVEAEKEGWAEFTATREELAATIVHGMVYLAHTRPASALAFETWTIRDYVPNEDGCVRFEYTLDLFDNVAPIRVAAYAKYGCDVDRGGLVLMRDDIDVV